MPEEFLKILFDRGQRTEKCYLYDDQNRRYHRHYYLERFECLWRFNKTTNKCTVSSKSRWCDHESCTLMNYRVESPSTKSRKSRISEHFLLIFVWCFLVRHRSISTLTKSPFSWIFVTKSTRIFFRMIFSFFLFCSFQLLKSGIQFLFQKME